MSGNDPEGHVAASIGVIANDHPGEQSAYSLLRHGPREETIPVKVAFKPFSSAHTDIGEDDVGEYRMLDLDVLAADDPTEHRPKVLLKDSDGTTFILAEGNHFTNKKFADLVEYGLGNLSEYVTVLGREIADPEGGFEPVGVHVALYVPDSER